MKTKLIFKLEWLHQAKKHKCPTDNNSPSLSEGDTRRSYIYKSKKQIDCKVPQKVSVD